MADYKDIGVERSGFVATIEIQRPPHNFFDIVLINSIADALEDLDKDDGCRAVVLAAQGKSFCAGANFGDGTTLDKSGQRPGEASSPVQHLYMQAIRLFRSKKPIIGEMAAINYPTNRSIPRGPASAVSRSSIRDPNPPPR